MNPQQPFELGPGRFDPPPLPRAPAIPVSSVTPPRPVIVIVMAIASILIALIALAAYGYIAMDMAGIVTRPPRPATASNPPQIPIPQFYSPIPDPAEGPAPPETDVLKVPKEGLDSPQRAAIIDALSAIHPSGMDEAQKQQLDHFLSVCGAVVFPKTNRLMTVERMRGLIRNSISTSESERQSHVTFVTGDGRLTVFQDRTSWLPLDEDKPLVTMLGHAPPASSRPGGGSGYGALTADEARQVSAAVNRIADKTLNSAQAATLQQQLESPQQDWLRPDYIPAPIARVSTLPDGSFMIGFVPGKIVTIDSQGQLPELRLRADISGRKWMFNQARPFAQIALCIAVIGMVLAIMLFASSVELLRGQRLGLLLHQIWAWIMLPLALGWLAWAWIEAHQLLGQPLGNDISRDPLTIFLVIGGGLVLLTWIYPVIVLSILRRRALREYCDSL